MRSSLLAIGLSLGLGCAISYATNNFDLSHENLLSKSNKMSQSTNNFLEENKKKSDVVTLSSGLQYKILSDGNGKQPKPEDVVTVHYEGTLINGTVFDSSYKRGQPASFPVRAVIQGWVEALQLMKEGSTWMLYIPANLAYGSRGAPPSIGPNETLIFKVNLISINK